MKEALYEATILRRFAGLRLERIPDETTALNFTRLLAKHEMAVGVLGYLGGRGLSRRLGTIVDATFIQRPVRPRTRAASAIQRRIRPRGAASLTSA
ncbi:hypothetical protein [Pseudomonas sp. LPB0260]|uniref:hypothetical protein n=1 Tax=Pseudomonas sp. LPB0260 TaxID=2614442 RepID=UPI0035327ED3